jgi:anti-sigma regulatory factor (Ser/Thr protein kinase)
MGSRFQITCAAEYNSLSILRDYLDQACDRYDYITPEMRYDLKLAVDEACTNIIEYGYAGMDPGTIILAFEIDPACISLTLTDFGQPFEPSEPEPPDIEEQFKQGTTSGFGLYFIYQTMDEIDYTTSEAGNTLSFIKRLKPA